MAKLTDFGESRSAMIGTKTVAATHTANLYRGSPAYMAPEALSKTTSQASMQDLMSMDICSLGMTIFHLMNPNIAYPYSVELEQQATLTPREALHELVSKRVLVMKAVIYDCMCNTSWKQLQAVYFACTLFDPTNRPTASYLQHMCVNGYVDIKSLLISQNSTIEAIDAHCAAVINEVPGILSEFNNALRNDNACTFLDILIGSRFLSDPSLSLEQILL